MVIYSVSEKDIYVNNPVTKGNKVDIYIKTEVDKEIKRLGTRIQVMKDVELEEIKQLKGMLKGQKLMTATLNKENERLRKEKEWLLFKIY